MSSLCRYCGRVELMWDNSHKSQSGKLIPLEKASGLPHQCSDNPYSKQQSTQQVPTQQVTDNTNGNTNGTMVGTELVLFQLNQLSKKLDKLDKISLSLERILVMLEEMKQ